MLINSPELFGIPNHMIMDPVHGGIQFFEHERRVISHPLFQRLRHIRQNDVLQFVFPGAVHSRFEHSIGAMHIAGRLFKSMIRGYIKDKSIKELNKEQIDAIQYCYGCLRLAALLHDVGHMPFSHQFEVASDEIGLFDEEGVRDLFNDSESDTLFGQSIDKITHEHYSILISNNILKSVDLPFEAYDIIGMMENGFPNPSEKFIKSAVNTISLFTPNVCNIDKGLMRDYADKVRSFFKDIISGEIDVDKMDYLLRDSYFTGCNYGSYNLDHLIKNIVLGYDDKWVGIALRKKGIGALEDFVYSRFRMYLQVYGHKTVVGLKWLLKMALIEMIKSDKYQGCVRETLQDMDKLAHFTDTFFWEGFREFAGEHPLSACADMVSRNNLSHIAALERMAPFELENRIDSLSNAANKELFYDECASKFSQIDSEFEKVRILVNDLEEGKKLEPVANHSIFFDKFEKVIVTHVYVRPDWYIK